MKNGVVVSNKEAGEEEGGEEATVEGEVEGRVSKEGRGVGAIIELSGTGKLS